MKRRCGSLTISKNVQLSNDHIPDHNSGTACFQDQVLFFETIKPCSHVPTLNFRTVKVLTLCQWYDINMEHLSFVMSPTVSYKGRVSCQLWDSVQFMHWTSQEPVLVLTDECFHLGSLHSLPRTGGSRGGMLVQVQ